MGICEVEPQKKQEDVINTYEMYFNCKGDAKGISIQFDVKVGDEIILNFEENDFGGAIQRVWFIAGLEYNDMDGGYTIKIKSMSKLDRFFKIVEEEFDKTIKKALEDAVNYVEIITHSVIIRPPTTQQERPTRYCDPE